MRCLPADSLECGVTCSFSTRDSQSRRKKLLAVAWLNGRELKTTPKLKRSAV